MRLALLLALCLPASASDAPPATWAQRHEMRGAWVVGWRQMDSPQHIDEAIAWAQKARLNTLFVQVRVDGDAYYRSDLVPRAEPLAGQPADFDPLAYALAKARPKGFKVHAWFNTGVIWRGLEPPKDKTHAFNAHPEWLLKDASGRVAVPRDDDPKPSVIEGNVWVEWANPQLRAHLAAVAAELASRYELDGIHLDFVRYPGRMGPRTPGVGYDPASLKAFKAETGLAPAEHTREWDEWRERQVAFGLRGIRDAVKKARPGMEVSAAVLAAWNLAEGRAFTAYRRWTEEGILDFAVLMAYFTEPSWIEQSLLNAVEAVDPRRVVLGCSLKAHEADKLALQLGWSRSMGLKGFSLFALDHVERDDLDAYLPKLRDLAIPDAADERYASREPLWNRVGVLDAAHPKWKLRFFTRRGNARLVVYPRGLRSARFMVGDQALPAMEFKGAEPASLDLSPYLKPFSREVEAPHDFFLAAEAGGAGEAEVFVVDSYAAAEP